MVCSNSPLFEFEKKNISQLLWNTNFFCYCTQEPIKPDRTHTCHAKQWPTPPSNLYINGSEIVSSPMSNRPNKMTLHSEHIPCIPIVPKRSVSTCQTCQIKCYCTSNI